jgi:hypothetical protein
MISIGLVDMDLQGGEYGLSKTLCFHPHTHKGSLTGQAGASTNIHGRYLLSDSLQLSDTNGVLQSENIGSARKITLQYRKDNLNIIIKFTYFSFLIYKLFIHSIIYF